MRIKFVLLLFVCCATVCHSKHLLKSSSSINQLTKYFGAHPIEEQSGITHILNNINESNDKLPSTQYRGKRQVTDWLIAPNTRWCGRGNLANGTYNHLGGASSADKCCRKHDHCKIYIPAMSNRFELFNYRPYTISHCTCDRRFRTCLKMANDEDAKTIGKLFFNMVQTQCFILKTETVCKERSTDGSGDCIRENLRHKAYLKNNKRF